MAGRGVCSTVDVGTYEALVALAVANDVSLSRVVAGILRGYIEGGVGVASFSGGFGGGFE